MIEIVKKELMNIKRYEWEHNVMFSTLDKWAFINARLRKEMLLKWDYLSLRIYNFFNRTTGGN